MSRKSHQHNHDIKVCSACGVVLIKDVNWSPSAYSKTPEYQCKLCIGIRQKKYWRTHPKVQLAYREGDRKVRKNVLSVLGGKCVKCGFADFRALQIDHINGGGLKELKTLYGRKYYNHIISLSAEERNSRYQCLCANCNWIKKYENNENPNINNYS